MFDFDEAEQTNCVEPLLDGRINEACLHELCGKDSQGQQRSACAQVVCMVPQGEDGWNYEQVVPVVGRDIKLSGLSILHSEPIKGQILLEAPSVTGSRFVRCEVQESRDIGHGYFHISLSGKEVVNVDAIDRNRIECNLANFTEETTLTTDTAVPQSAF
jgi:hypothetical protein